MVSLVAAMCLFAMVGAVSPGPVNVVAAYAGIRYGWFRASEHVLGASVAYALVVLICGLSLSQIADYVPAISPLIRWAGCGYLIWLVVKIFRAPFLDLSGPLSAPEKQLFIQGSLLQILNPKAWIFASSGVSLYVLNQTVTSNALWWFCLVSLIVCFVGVGVWAVVGQLLRCWLSSPARQKLFHYGLAAMLCVSVVTIAMDG